MVLKERKKQEQSWEENFNCLIKYINSSEEVKQRFNRTGNIDRQAIIENNGKKIKIGSWLNTQKQYLLKKYQAISIEEIEKDEKIPQEAKYRMLKLLNLGVSFPEKTRELEWWDKKYELLKQYINSSKEIKSNFIEYGAIENSAQIEFENKVIAIGRWLNAQKEVLMKKYKNMTIQEIQNDDNIPQIDKYKMEKLLSLGVTYKKNRQETRKINIQKANEDWKIKFELLEEYINSSEDIKTEFMVKGHIHHETVIERDGKRISLGTWVDTQKQTVMKKYQNKTISEIKNDDNIPKFDKYKMIKLLELGVSYPKDVKEMYEDKKADYIDIWDKNFESLKKYLDSCDTIKKEFMKTGKLKLTGNKLQDDDIERINRWIVCQKQSIMKEFSGKTIEEIESDENIHPVHKYKMKRLLEIGIKYPRDNIDWDKNFELLKEFINSSDQAKIDIQEKGMIDYKSIIRKDGREIKIGTWLMNQRSSLMKKYNGKTIKEIMADKTIPDNDKKRMKKLLKLGISYPKIHSQKIGKATYDAKVEDCDDAEFKLKRLKQEKIKINNL